VNDLNIIQKVVPVRRQSNFDVPCQCSWSNVGPMRLSIRWNIQIQWVQNHKTPHKLISKV